MQQQKDPSPWWRKLFSSNWWWYRQVDPDPATLPPPDKRPIYWRPHVRMGVVIWGVIAWWPMVAAYMNYDLPQEPLVSLEGKVVSMHEKSPHLELRISNGTTLQTEFPVQVSFMLGVKWPYEFDDLLHQFPHQCERVRMKGVFLKGVPFQRFRIWSFECLDGSYAISQAALANRWLSTRFKNHFSIFFLTPFVFVLILIAYFIRERKEYGR